MRRLGRSYVDLHHWINFDQSQCDLEMTNRRKRTRPYENVLWCGPFVQFRRYNTDPVSLATPKKPIVEETRYYTKLHISVPRSEVKYDSRDSRLYKRQATRKLIGLQLCSYLFTKKILKFLTRKIFFLTFSR